jgi:hypothetical protein
MTIENLNINPVSGELAPIIKRRRIRVIVTIQDMDTVDSRGEAYFILKADERADTIYDIIIEPIEEGGELPPVTPARLLHSLEPAMGAIARDLARKANA